MPVRLFVGNLPYDATEEDIRVHFSTAGNVLNVFVPLDRETGRKRGFAFVEYGDAAAANEAIRLLNNQPFKGRPLAVNEARAKESRPPGPGGFSGGFRPGPRPAPTGGFRPSGPPGSRPPGAPPSRDFDRPDASALEAGRDKHSRKFGPDAKPFKNRNQKTFRPEGGKKALKERNSGQLYSMDDTPEDKEEVVETEIDNFAESLDGESEENP
jgi:RNA recognition motif-containing protein